jgi:tight adherence protein C
MTYAVFAVIMLLSLSAAVLGTGLVQKSLVAQKNRNAVDRRLASFASKPVDTQLQDMGTLETVIRRLAAVTLLISRNPQTQARLVREAGIFGHGAVYQFLASRAALAIVGLILGPAIGAIAGRSALETTTFALGLGFAGYFGPALIVGYLARRRRTRVFREMPLFLDSVKLLLQTGASLELALRHVTRMETGAIPEIRRTLLYFLEDLDQGKSYEIAFDRWVEKLAIPEAEEFAGLMVQSIRHGTELSPMLEQFIQDQIQRRLAKAREAAGKRSVSLTVIMVTFFLPPLMMIIGAPAIVEIARKLIK